MTVQPAARLSRIEEYYFSRKLREVRQLVNSGQKILNLGIGNPDLAPPETVLPALVDAASQTGSNGYQPYMGIPELRAAMAEYYQRIYGVQVEPESELLPLMGSKEGIFHLSMAFLNPGDRVLVPDPGYPGYVGATRLAGGDTLSYQLSAENCWLPDLTVLQSCNLERVKLMWINYPHMPTGAIASATDFAGIARFCRERDILLCHDNPYSRVDTHTPQSVFSGSVTPGCVELNSLSKSHHMPGWRLGMLIAEAPIVRAVLTVKSNLDSGMYRPLQLAAVRALQAEDAWHQRQSDRYRSRKEIVYHLLERLQCRFERDTAGMFVWARLPEHVADSEAFVDDLLYRKGIFVAPGFIFGENGARYIRVSVCADETLLNEALNRISTEEKEQE